MFFSFIFFFKQKTAYEMRMSDWSSDVCSSDLLAVKVARTRAGWRMTTRGRIHDVRVLPWHIAPLTQHMIEKIPPDLSKFLICPMPGLLVTLHVGEGDAVEAGQPLAAVEAKIGSASCGGGVLQSV